MEERQKNKTITGVVIGIIALMLVVFGLVAVNRGSEPLDVEEGSTSDSLVNENTFDQTATLVTHSFVDGVHTYRGSIQAPTPCHTLTYEVEMSETTPIKATIHFTLHPPAEDEICAQVVTDVPFEIMFEAPESSAQADATLNGTQFFIIIGGKE
ncbi:MAG: hypothetical protein Q8Q18_00510 [bacterium]|nr:hypothetical protein [bacterium]